jgi:CHASE2 domain-containing sensor protein
MLQRSSKLRVLVEAWRWILGIAALLAIPSYGFTVPFHYAVIAHALAVLFYICVLLLFGTGHVIEGAIPAVLAVVLFALLSHSLQQAREKHERIQQQQSVSP